jgi:RiboL-PSP-HEPN
MSVPDLQGPYDDFLERLNDIRRIVCTVESCYRQPSALNTHRANINFSEVGPTTSNNTNSMALVFLASSYEEFVREEISECAKLLSSKYSSLPDALRHGIRSAYWNTSLQRLNYAKHILTKSEPKTPDSLTLNKIRPILELAQLFVINDDSSRIDPITTVHHSNNFRPSVVDEIAGRIGIKNFTTRTAESTRIKTHFGVGTGNAAAKEMRHKLDEFYDRRNEIVHSLSSTTGYGVDYVLDWITLFDAVAQSMKDALERAIATW